MKYLASSGNGKYIANMFWFSDKTPNITLETKSKENAILFDSNKKEKIIADKYPGVRFVPVKFSIDLQ